MYVCLCKAVTDSDIRAAVDAGATDLGALRDRTGASTGCGRCGEFAQQVIDERLAESISYAAS